MDAWSGSTGCEVYLFVLGEVVCEVFVLQRSVWHGARRISFEDDMAVCPTWNTRMQGRAVALYLGK